MAALLELLIISVSLAMDSLSVSIAGGFKAQKTRLADACKVAAFFGGFQAGMPLVGWLIGKVVATFITQFAPWIAFGLLTYIGIKMIKESFETDGVLDTNILQTKRLIMLSIATSIDALLVGITLSVLNLSLLLSVTVIGVVTFILCFFGFLFGKQLGKLFGRRIEIFGGIALILIGLKFLFER